MIRLFVLICLFALGCQALPDSGSHTEDDRRTTLPVASPYPFPETWLGTYEGNLYILGVDSIRSRIPMRFRLVDLDSAGCMRWELCYFAGEENEDLRSYLLAPQNPERGLYLLDELNSIQMHVQAIYDELISIFEVMGSRLVFRYRKINDRQIELLVYTHKNEATLKTGDTTWAGEQIPPVFGYKVQGLQRAVLSQVKPEE